MEENIKLIEHYMEYYSKDYVFRKAVEKLIKEYKKLENNNMKMALNGGSFAAKHYIEENYIPKSKVKEVRDEFDKMVQKMYAEGTEITDGDVFRLFDKLLEGDKYDIS